MVLPQPDIQVVAITIKTIAVLRLKDDLFCYLMVYLMVLPHSF